MLKYLLKGSVAFFSGSNLGIVLLKCKEESSWEEDGASSVLWPAFMMPALILFHVVQ